MATRKPSTQHRSKQSMNTFSNSIAKRSLGAAILAVAMVAGVVGYHGVQPKSAHAAATSNAAPLEDSKIAPLLSLDQAMETVAARVTPAIVNVAVTAKIKQQQIAEGMPEGMPEGMQQ